MTPRSRAFTKSLRRVKLRRQLRPDGHPTFRINYPDSFREVALAARRRTSSLCS